MILEKNVGYHHHNMYLLATHKDT